LRDRRPVVSAHLRDDTGLCVRQINRIYKNGGEPPAYYAGLYDRRRTCGRHTRAGAHAGLFEQRLRRARTDIGLRIRRPPATGDIAAAHDRPSLYTELLTGFPVMHEQPLKVCFAEKTIDAIFKELDSSRAPGVAVGIAIGGSPVYRKAFGL